MRVAEGSHLHPRKRVNELLFAQRNTLLKWFTITIDRLNVGWLYGFDKWFAITRITRLCGNSIFVAQNKLINTCTDISGVFFFFITLEPGVE